MGYGGGGFLSEAGLRERAQAQGRVFGAGGEGVRIWAFWLWDFGIIRNSVSAGSNSDTPRPYHFWLYGTTISGCTNLAVPVYLREFLSFR